MHFYAWKRGLKTGMYYLRTRPKADAIQFTVDQEKLAEDTKKKAVVTPGKENGKLEDSTNKTPVKEGVAKANIPEAKPLVDSAALGQAEVEEECLNCGA